MPKTFRWAALDKSALFIEQSVQFMEAEMVPLGQNSGIGAFFPLAPGG